MNRANLDLSDVDEVILGQSLQAGQGQNPARQASLKAGIPVETPAYSLNMLCGSGLKSVGLGFQAIMTGDSNIVIAGGQESMTKSPHVIHLRGGMKMGNATMVDSMITDGLMDAMHNIHMGETAENLAAKFNVSREEQDRFSVESQNRAEAAQKAGHFDEEIVAVSVPVPRKEAVIVVKDEYLKCGTKIENLSKLKACFIKEGTVTAGNASGINDSAAAVLLASANEVKKRNLKPLARVVAFAQTGCDPKIMGAGQL